MTIKPVSRCFKCGAILQSEEPYAQGYIKGSLLAKTTHRPLFCESCFNEIHPLKEKEVPSTSSDFLTMLNDARATDALIVYFVDLYSFECSFLKKVTELIKNLNIIVIATKRDLLPLKWDDTVLCEYVANSFNEAGMKRVSPQSIHISNLNSEDNIDKIRELILEERKRHDVYLIGAKQSGKSSFLSAFLRTRKNPTNRPISSGYYFGTNLRVMAIPLDASSSLYDTPGLDIKNSLFNNPSAPKEIIAKTRISSRKCILTKGGSLFIGLLARIDAIKISGTYVVANAYFAPKVQLKTVLAKENMDTFMDKLLEKKSLKPMMSSLLSTLDFDVYDLAISTSEITDIGIAGLGFISVNGKEGDIYRAYVPKGIGVYIQKSKTIKKRN